MPNRLQPIRRTGLILLGVWLLALFLVTAYTFKLVWDEELITIESRKQARMHALELLVERMSHALREAFLLPEQMLERLPSLEQLNAAHHIESLESPALQWVLLLDQHLKLVQALPMRAGDEAENLLAERVRVEGSTKHLDAAGAHIFIDFLAEGDVLMRLSRRSFAGGSSEWLLLGFNLNALIDQVLQPLMDEFSRAENGCVVLFGPNDDWRESAIHIPINRIFPGYSLIFRENPQSFLPNPYRILPLVFSVAILLALSLATWAAYRELRRSHAMAELRQRFLAHISHELKTPLALVRMYAETLHLGRVSDPERIQEFYRVILREAERLSEMIQNVLTFARFGQLAAIYHLHHGDLTGTVQRVLEEMSLNYEGRGFVLRSELATDLPEIPHDRQGITRILWNLLDNATKYANGVIIVRLRLAEHQVRLEVLDHGPGIPAADRARLLHPFERGWDTDAISGSGLGLALVAQVAEVHGAIFTLEDRPEGGLCACVAFPL